MSDAERPRFRLALDYPAPSGALAEHFAALARGETLASRCPDCGRVRAPASPICERDGTATETIRLAGRGRIEAMTRATSRLPPDGAPTEQVFVLVRIDGADTLMLGRLAEGEAAEIGAAVRLCAVAGERHPAQAAVFTTRMNEN